MASKSSTTTLFSTYKASKIHRNYSKNGANSSRYVVGSVGKACGKHIRFGGSGASASSSGTSCGGGSNHSSHANVAIATQVLNPSAIGGSLKNRRFVEHFGPKDDDEISFLSSKSRAVCSKVCFYGVSIGVTVIMITGLIVAVGYMQTEKDRIATRPVKLAQGQDFQSSTTHQPLAILYGTTTTSTIKPGLGGDSENEIQDIDTDDDMDEISVDGFKHQNNPLTHHHHNRKNGIFNFKVSTDSGPSSSSLFDHHQNHHHHHHHNLNREDIRSSTNDDENNISDEYHHHQSASPTTHKSQQGNPRFGHHRHDDTTGGGEDEINTSPEEEEVEDTSSHHEIAEDDVDPPIEDGRSFSEVRVKPPSDFKFAGISFEIPIYRVNTSFTTTTLPIITSATPTPSAITTTDVDEDVVDNHNNHNNNDEELHTELHAENGLDEIETESRSSSASVVTPPPTTKTVSEITEETKELETSSVNHSNSNFNSGLNFTSLIDSQEEETTNKGNSERGDVLFSEENNKNYANANIHNSKNPSSQDIVQSGSNSLDLDSMQQHFKPSKPTIPSTDEEHSSIQNIGFHYNSNSNSDRYNSNSDLNKDDGIIVKTSSRYSSNIKNHLHDKTLNANNDDDFAIGESSTTSTVATLQTDIFDADDEFQTSASEDSEIDADNDGDDDESLLDDKEHASSTPIIAPPTTNRPQKSNNNNRNDGNNRKSQKGQRRGKGQKRPTPQPPYLDADYDTETTTTTKTNVKTNGRIKDGKKLSLRPNKKSQTSNLKQDIQIDLGGITTSTTGSTLTSVGNDEAIPNLDYKVDFSRFIIPTTPASLSLLEQQQPGDNNANNNDNIEYQPPNHNSNQYPSFNFAPPPPEHHKPFNLEEYLNKHAKKGGNDLLASDPSPSPSLSNPQHQQQQPQPSSNLDLSALSHYQSYKVDPSSSPLLYTTSSGAAPSSHLDPSAALFSSSSQPDHQFSKRTFYNMDSFTHSNDNSFAHLLGPQSPTSNFGQTTATGATLNLFQPQQSHQQPTNGYNFDGGNFQSNNPAAAAAAASNNYNIPNFNTLSASAQSNAQHGFSVDANGAFSLIQPSSLPYPNIPTGGGGGGGSTNNYGVGVGGNNLGGTNNYQNTFSFNNEPISSSKNLVLTTGNGQTPTYNTITQGIHLLTLLSGRGAGNSDQDGGNGNNNGYDQLSSGSNIYQNIAEAPPGLEGQHTRGTIGSAGLNFNNNWKNNNADSSGGFQSSPSNFQSYAQDFYPNKNFKNFENQDQDSSASGNFPSFSRTIVMKAQSDLDVGGSVNKAIIQTSQNWGGPTPTSTTPSSSLPSSKVPGNRKNTQPKSLSIKILSPKSTNKNKPRLTLTSTTTPSATPKKRKPVDSSAELESLAPPRSRKRLLLDPDMDVGESRLHSTIFTSSNSNKNSKNELKSSTGRRPGTSTTLAISSGANVKGLKSGFFN